MMYRIIFENVLTQRYIKKPRSLKRRSIGYFRRRIKIMDPDCAICRRPAVAQCDCEAKGLDLAVRQAEQRMMTSVMNDIRSWVRGHAQDYILEYFTVLSNRRHADHATHMAAMTEHAAYYYRSRPNPADIAAANAALKAGIDEDWRSSVQRYPEVLEYFYGLVDLSLPNDDDPAIKDPPLSALNGGVRKARQRTGLEEATRKMGLGGVSGQGAPSVAPPMHAAPRKERMPPIGRERERERERHRRDGSTPYAPPVPAPGYGYGAGQVPQY